jgi:diguanylate cyclase (GGDEF)-like protein
VTEVEQLYVVSVQLDLLASLRLIRPNPELEWAYVTLCDREQELLFELALASAAVRPKQRRLGAGRHRTRIPAAAPPRPEQLRRWALPGTAAGGYGQPVVDWESPVPRLIESASNSDCRLVLMDRLSQALVTLDQGPGRVGLFVVDLDNFKAINDSFGHDAGDRVLAEVGRRLSRISRRTDSVARVGGDEFMLLRPNLRDDEDARLVASATVRAIGGRFVHEGSDLTVTASIGVVVTADPLARPAVLLRRANIALYTAKSAGGDCFRIS